MFENVQNDVAKGCRVESSCNFYKKVVRRVDVNNEMRNLKGVYFDVHLF